MSVVIYTTRFCSYCVRAKQLLDSKGVEYKEIPVDQDPVLRRELMEKSGQRTVPQIWIGSRHVGGYSDLYRLEMSGQLNQILAAST